MNLFGMEKHHTKSMWLLAILIAFSTTVCAQGTSVTGRVSDEKGELLIGVSVQEIGHSMVLMIILRGQNWMRRQTNFLQREKKRKAMKWIMQLPIVTTDFLLKRTMVVLPRR